MLYCRVVPADVETEHQRARRHRMRALFDRVAPLYEASRLGYPDGMVEFVMATAGVGAGSTILEVGCGTGQLTEALAGHGFNLTAIDIGPAMIAAARQRVADADLSFQVASFEDFAAAGSSFDLIVSGTAFHWVDPEVKFSKPARLLRPGGWLALLATRERYDDPFGTALTGMWAARSEDGGARARQRKPSETEILAGTGQFEEPVGRMDARRLVLPVETVIGVENTRATSLSWPEHVRQQFTDEIRRELRSQAQVGLTQETVLTMTRLPPR
jgi:ubiquinone/menaquinone biosynthesis C-methylase UbiE